MIPSKILNVIAGREVPARGDGYFPKKDPVSGKVLCDVARSGAADVEAAVDAAHRAQPEWASLTPVHRGEILYEITIGLRQHKEEAALIVSQETGKSLELSAGEVDAAVAQGLFMAGEGQRMYGRTVATRVANRSVMLIRQPIGVAALIVAANTPLPNLAWKIFPALICGNTAVVKAPEDAPASAWYFAKIAKEAGLPAGVLNIVQGIGAEAGPPLVKDDRIGAVSFTGSTQVGKQIARLASERLIRVSLELGGKNPMVICDDADLENAIKWTLLSAFSNAGQRCASASRIIIFDSIYDEFKRRLLDRIRELSAASKFDESFGPVINEKHLQRLLSWIDAARTAGANVLTGGCRLTDPDHRDGFFLSPTILEDISPVHEVSRRELFGPITILYRASDYSAALALANDCDYGLTASIHTRNVHRAMHFIENVQAGVAVVNAGTHGSEPHLPFGGRKQSGNGAREPGLEALDFYSELKNVYLNYLPMEIQS